MINMALNHPLEPDQMRRFRAHARGTAGPRAAARHDPRGAGEIRLASDSDLRAHGDLAVPHCFEGQAYMKDLPAEEKLRVQAKTGYPMIGVDVRVVDDDGNDVAPDSGVTGEVIARANVVMAGYWRQPEATDAVIVDGWFHTGDMALLDSEGFIEVVDRKKDLIISGGENISSIEVEGFLYKHPAVLEAAIVAAPDERWGEVPAAIIVLKPGARRPGSR